MKEPKVLNVRLPFMEAIEQLKGDDKTITGITDGRSELFVTEEGDLYVGFKKTGLKLSDILENEWYVVVGGNKPKVNEYDYKCMRCGHKLIIGGNHMAADVGLVDYDKELSDDDFMITNMICPHCGAGYEVYDTPKNEWKDYEYFKEEIEKEEN